MQPCALVLDFGGPVLLTPFEVAADQPGTPAHQLLRHRGPMAPQDHPDPLWEAVQAGHMTEQAYWADRARHWHAAGGSQPDIRSLIAHLYEPARPGLVRPQARELVADAHRAGHQVAILTNDLHAFHSAEWVEQTDVIDDVDVVVDGSVEGVLKPDPRLYGIAGERLGVQYAQMVFLDDQASNIRGAAALGIDAVWFDPSEPDTAFGQVRKRLGLDPGVGR